MPSLREYREEIDALLAEGRKLKDEHSNTDGTPWPEDADKRFREIHSKADEISKKIAACKADQERDNVLSDLEARARGCDGASMNDPAIQAVRPREADQALVHAVSNREKRGLALQAWCLGECRTSQHEEAIHDLGWNVHASRVSFTMSNTRQLRALKRAVRRNSAEALADAIEFRALSRLTDAAGGYTVDESWISQLEVAMQAIGGIELAGDMMVTARGEPIHWPTMDDRQEGVIVGELDAVGDLDPTFGEVLIGEENYSSGKIRVSRQLATDNIVDLESELAVAMGTRIARKFNSAGTNGASPGPTGIMVSTNVGHTTTGGGVGYQDLVDTVHSVDPAHRVSPSVGWMAHDLIFAELRKIVDTTGRPIWNDDQMREGQPARLLGYPTVINQAMASAVAVSNKIMLFGDMSKIKNRRVNSLEVQRLVETAAVNYALEFIAWLRQDSVYLTAGSDPLMQLVIGA